MDKIIQKKNLFSEEELSVLKQELLKLSPLIVPMYYTDKMAYRVSLDEHYRDHRNLSAILALVAYHLYNEDMKKQYKQMQDLAYRFMSLPNMFITYYSEFRDEKEQSWHFDDTTVPMYFMSYIIYMSDKFEHGELIVKLGKEQKVIVPEANMLVLLPSYMEHMIVAPKYNKGDEYRKTINGFCYLQG